MAGIGILETYSSTAGAKEDILDLITQISPNETPFLSRAGVSKAIACKHIWLTQALDNNATGEAVAEGDSAAANLTQDQTRYNNYTQIDNRVFIISGTEEAVSHYGLDSMYAYQLEKAMKELKIKMEKNLIYGSATGAGAATAAARTLMGALAFGITDGTGVSGLASVSALTESVYNNLLQYIYADGGNPTHTFVAGYLKRRISAFASNNARYIDMGQNKKLTGVVSIYESDFGVQEIVLDRWVTGLGNTGTDGGCGVVCNMSEMKVAYLRKPFVNPLGNDGDRKKTQILVEYTLEALAPTQVGYLSAFATA